MEAPAVTRYRRPFLAPVWLTALAVVVVLALAFAIWHSASTTVVVLVRPAEREAGAINDPPLSPEGERRAERLAEMLGATSGVGRINAIYVSDSQRAQEIIAPLLERLGRKAEIVQGDDIGALASRLTRGHDGEAVLFVGNGSNIPPLLHDLSGADVSAAHETDRDTLYVISLPTYSRASVLRLVY